MPFLIKLNLEANSVKDIKPLANEEAFRNLKVRAKFQLNVHKYLNLSHNKIVEFSAIKVAALQELNLNDNRIEKFEGFDGHPKLKKLELRKNKVSALTVFVNLPELKELYLTENKVKQIQGIEILQSL
jgi:Leucine-rich repeat (LRR) protein